MTKLMKKYMEEIVKMSTININLNGKNAEIINEYPIVFSNEDTIEIIINNYQKEHKYKLIIYLVNYVRWC